MCPAENGGIFCFFMDIFCQIEEKLKSQIIDESKNFYLLHDGFPLMEGHLLLIPKKHFDCYLSLDKNLIEEFNLFKNKVVDFLTKYYQKPVIFEHGIAGQTVFHAHLHLLPTDILITKQIKKVAKATKITKVPYLYYEVNNKKIYYQPIKKIIPGFFHYYYALLLNQPTNGIKRSANLKKILLKVKKNYLNYGKER